MSDTTRTDVNCILCGKPVGNSVFTVCDECWDKTPISENTSIETLLPSTYYADRPIVHRVEFMVNDWRRAIEANLRLEEKCENLHAKWREVSADNERLRNVIRSILMHTAHIHGDNDLLAGLLKNIEGKARRALEETKP